MQAISILRAARTLGLAAAVAVAGVAFAQNAERDRMLHSVVTVTTQPSNASLKFSGQVRIDTRISVDVDTGAKKLHTVFDFTGVTAKRGPVSYTTAYQEEFVQPLAANHTYELELPVTATTARTVTEDTLTAPATFSLNVDPATGAISSGTGVIRTQ